MLNLGLCMLSRLTLALRCIPLRVPLEILLMLGSSLIRLIKKFSNFLSLLKLVYIDRGNNCQCASKLCKHLSDDLNDKLMTRFDNYVLMRGMAGQ